MEIITSGNSEKPLTRKAAKSPLGILTNSATPKPVRLDKIVSVDPNGSTSDLVRATTRYVMQESAAFLLPETRVKNCLKLTLLPHGAEIHHNSTKKTAKFGNLARCGSIWNCPCCASKVSEERKKEIEKLVHNAEMQGCQVQMVTLTAPHQRTDDYGTLVSKLKSSMRDLTKPKAWKEFLKKYSVLGMVRAFECTHSENNGYHPHFHLLVIFRQPLKVELQRGIKKDFYKHWLRVTSKNDLGTPSYRRGVDIRLHDALAEYLTKTGWSLGAEMTKTHIKKGKNGSRSPFQLLHDYAIYDDKRAGMLFKHFAETMKGYMQLTWSRGLKDWFEVDEKTDEELVNQADDNGYDLFGIIPSGIFKKCWGSRGSIIEVARAGDMQRLQKFISELTHTPLPVIKNEMSSEMKLYLKYEIEEQVLSRQHRKRKKSQITNHKVEIDERYLL